MSEEQYKPKKEDLTTFQKVRDYLVGIKNTINQYLVGTGQFAPQPMFGMQPAYAAPGMQPMYSSQPTESYGGSGFSSSRDVYSNGLIGRLNSAAGKYLSSSKGQSSKK